MKRILYISAVSITLISFVIPIFISDDISSYLSLSATLHAALCTLLTLVIAIMLYDRFSLERELADKQFDAVLKLKEKFLSHNILFFWKDENGKRHKVIVETDGTVPDLPKTLLDTDRLFWSNHAFLELLEHTEGIQPLLLPKEIGRFYDRMPVHGFGACMPVTKLEDHACFIDTDCAHPEWTESDLGYEDIRNNNNSIKELCENYRMLNEAVNKWLKEHDVYNLVNFDDIYTINGVEYRKSELFKIS